MRTKAGLLWGRRPVMYGAVIRLGMLMLTSFGVNITDVQQLAVIAFTEAILMLVTNSYVDTNTPQYVKPRRG
jgi:hypothetical protein